jgi:glutaminyl-peptide cyclotransferase
MQKAMRNFVCVFLILALNGCLSNESQNKVGELFDGRRAYTLAAKQLNYGHRMPGTIASRQVSEWILMQLEQYEWEVEEQEFLYRKQSLRNLIGRSTWESENNSPIILGAHYDTRPQADKDEETPFEPVPGANDGASGVAVLLELARVLPQQNLRSTVWLVFFDAEDSGGIDGWEWVVGSSYFAANLQIEPSAVIIVDMVGDDELELYYERNSDQKLAEQIWSTAQNLGYNAFVPEQKYALIDDHTPFLQHGFVAVDIIDFDYPYWHTTQDTLDKISYQSLEQVGRTLQVWLSTYSE